MNNNFEVVCFGEVLWDILPSGAEPGGAPMNVAYHLHRQHKKTALITRIGEDAEGKKLLDLFKSKAISTEHFQIDKSNDTGKVYATRDDKGDMTYDIVKPSAWDFIQWEDAFEKLLSNAKYFVFGSLAARHEPSRQTLYQLLEAAPQKVFDINLRAPHYDKNVLVELLNKADLLKMNEEELAFVAPWFSTHNNMEDQMKVITDKLNLSMFVVTKGKHGALLYKDGAFVTHPGIQVQVADTVGSGDAFLAAVLANSIDNMPAATILERAIQLGSFVATKRGAMPMYDISEVSEFRR